MNSLRPSDHILTLLKLSLTSEVFGGPILFFIKSSLFLLYLEIFSSLRWLRLSVYLGLWVTGLFYLSTVIAYLVLCAPKSNTQTGLLLGLSSHKCLSQAQALNVVIGAFNLASDIYLLGIPLPAVWSLQMALKRKIGILMIFLTGVA